MKRSKACPCENCTEYKKKYYKDSDNYCLKCGAELVYACKHKKCFEPIPAEVEEKFCPTHLKEREEAAERRFEVIKKAAGATALIAFSAKVIHDGFTAHNNSNKKKK